MSVVLPVPSSPDSPITFGAWSDRPSSSPNWLSSLADRRIGGKRGASSLELEELVAQEGRQLEVELFGGCLHLLLQHANDGFALGVVGGPPDGAPSRRALLRDARVGNAGDESNIPHRLDDGPWRDAVFDAAVARVPKQGAAGG